MFTRLRRFWRAAPIATVVLVLSIAMAGFFTVRSLAFWFYWHGAESRQQPIEPWMTPGYIAHSWHVPPEIVLEAVGAPMPPPKGPMNLIDIAHLRDVPVETLVEAARVAVEDFRENRPERGNGAKRP
ncbi:hypothetical protein [Celeribacter arenosi]|uniref:Uncharacterized protein n=1 Tax=Celeribacter arenosi TaxID=792649 RepID=A0ABP7KEZ3_9RHOB